MRDRAYIISKILEEKIEFAEMSNLSYWYLSLDLLKEIAELLKRETKGMTESEKLLLNMLRVNLKDYQTLLDEIGYTPIEFETFVFDIFIRISRELINAKRTKGEFTYITHLNGMIAAASIHMKILEGMKA